jgi:oligopeptide transport system ATP-binding protein
VDTPLLNVRNVKKYFPVRSHFLKRQVGWIRAVDRISFEVFHGEVIGLVGESGCGKSTLGKTILGMHRADEGEVIFKGRDVNRLSREEVRKVRRGIQYVYQDSGAALDNWWTVERLLREPLIIHTELSRREMDERILTMLEAVGLSKGQLKSYPHEFSGGQQRRIGLARILVLNPELIIFDEPTAGLDVSVQAKILDLLNQLKENFHLTYLVISHNLSVIQMICSRTAVMYLGKIVEIGPSERIFDSPRHPYTRILIDSIPEPGGGKKEGKSILQGEIPSPDNIPQGCRFQTRCPFKRGQCEWEEPALVEAEEGHFAACHGKKQV